MDWIDACAATCMPSSDVASSTVAFTFALSLIPIEGTSTKLRERLFGTWLAAAKAETTKLYMSAE